MSADHRADQADRAAVETLVCEGYRRADVEAAIDSLIDAGLEILDQPEAGWTFTAGEVDALRDQLDAPAGGDHRVQDQAAAYAAATATNDNMIARREIAARHEARQAAGVDFLESRMVYRAELDALDALEASP